MNHEDDELPPCVGEKMRDAASDIGVSQVDRDLQNFGVCFEVDGVRVHPSRVRIHRRGSTPLAFKVHKDA